MGLLTIDSVEENTERFELLRRISSGVSAVKEVEILARVSLLGGVPDTGSGPLVMLNFA